MPVFNLSDDNIKRLQKKFQEFKDARAKIHKLILDYVADYRQFKGTPEDKKEFLEKKYGKLAPGMTHLAMFDDSEIYFHVQDIATILGRTQPAISITLSKIEKSGAWAARLISLRKITKSANGNKIFVYKQEIFDLIIDKYEEEYILRFSNPRRGNQDNTPDISEVRKFWDYLKQLESHNNFLATTKHEHEISLPDVPAMRLPDIFRLIWEKVFYVKIWTVASLIFAICFEIVRRYIGVNLYFAIVPAVLIFACVILIRSRKFSPDIFSNIGAGALLFVLLWISGTLSISKEQPQDTAQKLMLNPSLPNGGFKFSISAKIFSDIKEFFYRVSPDEKFRSTGFIEQYNPKTERKYPNPVFDYKGNSDVAEIDVKYLDNNDKESKTWHFSFDMEQENLKLRKQNTLTYVKTPWLEARRVSGVNLDFIMIELSMLDFSAGILKAIVYGINTSSPDIVLSAEDIDHRNLEILKQPAGEINFVSSYIVFTDGTSSDIRISRID